MTVSTLQAGQPFPDVTTPKWGGGSVDLGKPRDGHDWKLVVVYRGKHCPLCTKYLQTLNEVAPALGEIGVDVVAVSADSAECAADQLAEVQPDYAVGYDLSVEQMRALGLYISSPRNGMKAERPFAEPGLFVINDEGKVQIIDVSNVPFARPDPHKILMGVTFLRNLEEKFPVNGSYA